MTETLSALVKSPVPLLARVGAFIVLFRRLLLTVLYSHYDMMMLLYPFPIH